MKVGRRVRGERWRKGVGRRVVMLERESVRRGRTNIEISCRDTVTITNRELERKKKKCAGGKKQKPANSMRLDGAAEGCLTARRDQWKLSLSPQPTHPITTPLEPAATTSQLPATQPKLESVTVPT